MDVDLLPEPRYRRTVSGNIARVHKPSKYRVRNLKVAVFERDGWTCQECGRFFNKPEGWDGWQYIEDLELGHVIPYHDGGPYVEENIQAECRPCNQSKGARR